VFQRQSEIKEATFFRGTQTTKKLCNEPMTCAPSETETRYDQCTLPLQ